jgi:hypothetical protein
VKDRAGVRNRRLGHSQGRVLLLNRGFLLQSTAGISRINLGGTTSTNASHEKERLLIRVIRLLPRISAIKE